MEKEAEISPSVKEGEGLCSELLTELLNPIPIVVYSLFVPSQGFAFFFFNSPATLVRVPESAEILSRTPD